MVRVVVVGHGEGRHAHTEGGDERLRVRMGGVCCSDGLSGLLYSCEEGQLTVLYAGEGRWGWETHEHVGLERGRGRRAARRHDGGVDVRG
jgi:hypothetical protein